ncbi:MAG: 1,2-phenylacetyl-CoA epoxidase subunit PaaD [Casimicrobiaceae bacterium]
MGAASLRIAAAAVAVPIDRARAAPSLADVACAWSALADVPDPEIPMVSVVELGIVREVMRDAQGLAVVVTPTYSGCPATDVIAGSIVDALAAAGLDGARVVTRLSPPWTTDWMAPESRRKLAAFGIAPPGAAAPRIDVAGISPLRRARVAVPCPRCASSRTRLVSQFGSTACKAHYRCDACLEPFDYFKPH